MEIVHESLYCKLFVNIYMNNVHENPYYEYYIHGQPWEFGIKIVHKILLLLVQQCQMTVVGLQERSIPNIPRSFGTVLLDFLLGVR
jgi:hypothetical protein